jgi:DNA-binding transcriptional LysR family regulator
MAAFAMDPKRMLYFVAIVETGSMSNAARQLGVSQPALSLAMERLEEETGTRLLDRNATGAHPTLAGEKFFHHARKMRDDMERARISIGEEGQQMGEPVRFACLPSLSGSVIAKAINAWQTQFPDHPVRVFERVQIDLLEGLLRRDFDFAIGVTDYYNVLVGLRQRVLFQDRLCVIARADHPLVTKPNLGLADIVGFPWVVPPAGQHRTLLEEMLLSAGLQMPTQQIVCSSATLLKSLVALGDHLALLPVHAIRAEGLIKELTTLPLSLPQLDRRVAVLFRDGYQFDPVRNGLVTAIQTSGLGQNGREKA